MPVSAELEIGIHHQENDRYSVELRYHRHDSDTDSRLLKHVPLITLDRVALRAVSGKPDTYGALLAQQLFENDLLRKMVEKVCTTAESSGTNLHVRLYLAPNAEELHSLRWETLWTPDGQGPWFTGKLFQFSRYMAGFDWRQVQIRPKTEMDALIVIASPEDLDEYGLTPLDVSRERDRAETGLKGVVRRVLDQGRATFAQVTAELRKGCDILYLVCHGSMRRGESWLWLENEDGKVDRLSGSEFVRVLRGVERIPRLVVLISCDSARVDVDSEGQALAALGPVLAAVGVPTVLAMQGSISMASIDTFLPIFFKELNRHGNVENAVSIARGAISRQSDWWMPALFSRLKSGRLWYAPSFSGGTMEKWPALLRHVRKGRCTPILGPGMSEPLFGSRREIARNWAEFYHFPMTPHQCEDLSHVAQYLAIHQDSLYPFEELVESLEIELDKRHGDLLPPDRTSLEFQDKLRIVCEKRRQASEEEPFRVLAELKLPLYITADNTHQLEDALKEVGLKPRSELCRWNRDLEHLKSVFDRDADYWPSREEPLVYRLFGDLDDPDSLVLTEDNFFEFLIGVTGNDDLIPYAVRQSMADTALLFLGFRLTDWDFRVLFHGLMNREGRYRRRRYAHVGVQIDPEESQIMEPARARKYLEGYFGGADISIYWGKAEDFLAELHKRLNE